LVWFRRDLRIEDNPALNAAIESGARLIPVFIWAPEEEAPWAPGAASRWWLHQSLEKLVVSLRKRTSNLIIRRGPTKDALLKLAIESGATALYWNRLYDPATVVRDRELKKEFRERCFIVESFPGNVLFEPGTIQNSSHEPFRVFTAFWNACLKAPSPPVPQRTPEQIPSPKKWPAALQVSDLALEPEVDWAAGLRESWKPGEAGAAEHMQSFLDRGQQGYATERDRPDHSGTSRLSPHLHFGEVSVRQIWHAANNAAYLRQIVWREFAHHLLFHYPHTAVEPLRPEFQFFPWRFDERLFKAWTRGDTGYSLVDAGMRELWRTGWMHNRVRMVTSSFLVKHLLISWQEGAAWFWDTLVDADLANNTLGWQWIAGCGADAAPYFRIFNPLIQAKKFDPDGDYVRRWVPKLSAEPIVNHEEARKKALAAFASIRRSPGPMVHTEID
jgi:deoxyribodipyrimidine photo-lyase